MSSRKRSGAAFLEAMQSASEGHVSAGNTAVPQGQGNWSRMAVRNFETRIDELSAEVKVAHQVQYDGILAGTVPLVIPTAAIVDEVGSDRILSGPEGSADAGDPDRQDGPGSFEKLVDNIARRGLRTPLRVRPVDPAWRPDPDAPHNVAEVTFALQSGRRRLAACRALGRDPICFISFSDADSVHRDDLEERFFENAARQDLTLVERLYSIGLIRNAMPGKSMRDVSAALGVPLATLSRGAALVAHFEALSRMLDLRTATRDQIDAALKELRDADAAQKRKARDTAPKAKRHAVRSARTLKTRHGALRVRTKSTGALTFTLESETLSLEDLPDLARHLESFAGGAGS